MSAQTATSTSVVKSTHLIVPATSATAVAVDGGVTPRVVFFSLLLAFFFGYIDPIIDAKLANTFLGAQHLPPGAVGVLIVVLLFINPATRLAARHMYFPYLLVGMGLLCAAFAGWRYTNGVDGPGVWTPAAIAALLLVCAAMGRRPLSRNETLVVYVTCLVSVLVPGHGAENFFIPNMMGPFYFATRENKWLDFLQAHTPQWLTPALWVEHGHPYGLLGRKLVEGWYSGHAGVPWAAWIVPLLVWCALILALYVMLACLGVMLRAQWAEHEALAFPLLRLPMELTEDMDRGDKYGTWSRFLHNPLTWSGFSIAVFIQTLNGLNFYFPDVPKFPLSIDTGPLLTEPPWNQIGWTPIQIYPIAIGITYLLTSETSFSLWFFFWIVRFQLIAAYFFGFVPNALPNSVGAGGKLFIGYQQVGVYLAYAAIVLWTGRMHYGHIVRRAFGRARMGDGERREMMSYPVAFWGFVLSLLFLLVWSVLIGISPLVAVLMWTCYLVLAIGLTRVVVEGGLLFVQQGWTALGTMAQLVPVGPGTWMPANVIVPASFLQGAIMWDFRGFLLPSYVQGFKLAHDRQLSARPLLALLVAVILITLPMGVLMRVKLGYDAGALGFHSWFAKSGAQLPATTSNTLLKGVQDVSWMNWIWLLVGAVLTYLLMLARSRFLWFPLHPIGYLVALGYAMHTLWFSIFIGWLVKVAVTRFGGVDTYRKTTPIFLGLALGDVTMMLVWLLVDGWQGRTYHYLVPT
ncbi:MAG: hypothetical protein JO316_04310 [Abitibacteriaceae bacterium]|nr:hypothetical protein [Abditibacteriaceae bacterium]MBV9864548.1 hypothetical protein [Abditibacteriaceae bacterium]